MKTFTKMAAQGDFIIFRIDRLPDNVVAMAPINGEVIVAHSETGHNHVMERTKVDAYKPKDVAEVDLYDLFLVVKEPTEIVHQRSFDTHETILVNEGTYQIKRQREYTAEGFRKAAD